MPRISVIILLLTVQCVTAYSQRMKTVMLQPKKFHINALNNQEFIETDLLDLTEKWWTVYSSDTAINTLIKPTGPASRISLGFMDKFYVLESDGEFLHLIKDNEISPEGFVSKSMIDYGWIHHKHLLLADRSLTNKDGLALLAIAANHLNKGFVNDYNTVEIARSTKFLFLDPELTFKSSFALEEGLIYFVYKTTDKAALIGVFDRINPANYHTGIIGWTALNNVVLFENRLAIEPNWEASATYERKTKQIYTTLFIDPLTASKATYSSRIDDEYAIWSADPLEERWQGSKYRFPVIANSGNILRVGLFSNSDHMALPTSPGQMLARSDEVEKLIAIRDLQLGRNKPGSAFISSSEKLDLNYLEAFTLLYQQSLNAPLYKFVYLLNRMEIMQLSDFYKGLRRSVSENTLHAFLQNFQSIGWIDQNTPFDSLSVDFVLQVKSGLPLSATYFGTTKMVDLSIPENDFISAGNKRLLSKLDLLIKQLDFIHQPNDPKFSFSSNHIMYYWIPIDNFL